MRLLLGILVGTSLAQSVFSAPVLNVGSKRFAESYILGEVVKQTALAAGEVRPVHQRGLGNTAVVLGALKTGAIDIYPEYTGTIAREILKLDEVPPLRELNVHLAGMGLAASVSLGFENKYALAMRTNDARAKGITRLSQLEAHAELRLGLSQEFLGRTDGWPGLKRAYDLQFVTPRGIDHGLAYEAIAHGQVDVIDVYSTDAKIEKYGLTVLADDRHYFPSYEAVLLHRADLPTRLPRSWAALANLAGRVDDTAMRRMNAAAELDGKDFAAVAAEFVSRLPAGGEHISPQPAPPNDLLHKLFGPDLVHLGCEHVALVFASLAASVALGLPLGILAAKRPAAAGLILGAAGVVQTIPALALLAFLVPLTGRIGAVPAFIALAMYALLPIVRNTHAGLSQVPRSMIQAAQSLGLTPGTILHVIELPLAGPTIWAGVKTSAVINVGTATIAAFIGAGGFGERIVTGLALNDHTTLLAGAIPAAALALVIQGVFNWGERMLVPAGLRNRPRNEASRFRSSR